MNTSKKMQVDHNKSIGVKCPGCDAELTIANAGGYRRFCQKCVDAIPPFPTERGGYVIKGEYPSFQWVSE